jgi:hypothetical protein
MFKYKEIQLSIIIYLNILKINIPINNKLLNNKINKEIICIYNINIL